MSAPAERGAGQPWYREPMMWLVVAVPTLTVVGGLVTLVLATLGGDPVVRDDFRREGLAIHADPARDAAAVAAGARAVLTFDGGARQLRATVSLRHGRLPARLLVVLSHAARAEFDRMVSLELVDGAYQGRLEPLPGGHWHVEVTPQSRGWRLRGEFAGTPGTVELRATGGR